MNESRRTTIYVVVAAVMALVAWWLTPPVEITPQEFAAAKIGEPFFKDFNPLEATSIRVVGFDEAKAMQKPFAVKFENGKWTIPSRHNYPADGADRLAKTATSIKGIKREEFVSDSDQNHEKLGVVDPLDADQSKLKGRGQRITLSKGDDTLVDLIIGKQLKDRPGFYYVRRPDEKSTYVAKLTVDLSTKFSDWIETDLLKLAAADLKEIVIDNSSIDEVKGRIVKGEVNILEREKSGDPWKLEGLEESKEELETSKVTTMVNTLDDLKLLGVRPKPKGLRPDLSLDPEYVRNRGDLNQILGDLQDRGFIPLADKNKQPHLYSKEGELEAATSKGVVYTLKFGDVFLGDESEIEIGSAKEGDEKKEKNEGDEKDEKTDKDAGSKQSGRYLFVSVHFDDKYLGPPPEEPEKPAGVTIDDEEKAPKAPKISPKKSGSSKTAPKDDADENNSGSSDAKTGGDEQPAKKDDSCGQSPGISDDADSTAAAQKDKPDSSKDPAPSKDKADDESTEGKDDSSKKDDASEDSNEEKPKPAEEKKEKSPEEIKKDYQSKLKKYKQDLKDYEEKVEAGKKSVDELNARFADWYYVISADNFNKLHLARKDLVKEKGKSPDDKKTDDKKTDKATDPFPTNDADPGEDDPDQKPDQKEGAGDEKKPDGK